MIMIIKEHKVFFPFTYSHHSQQMLMQQYIDELNNFNTTNMNDVIIYLQSLEYFDQTIFLLYLEYNSIRQVSEETNVKYTTIYNRLKEIKTHIKLILKRV